MGPIDNPIPAMPAGQMRGTAPFFNVNVNRTGQLNEVFNMFAKDNKTKNNPSNLMAPNVAMPNNRANIIHAPRNHPSQLKN